MTENISVDRLAAIKETQSLKNSNFSDEAKIVARQIQKARNSLLCEKDFSEKQPVAISEKNPLCGIYFYKCEDSTLYFNIESITLNNTTYPPIIKIVLIEERILLDIISPKPDKDIALL